MAAYKGYRTEKGIAAGVLIGILAAIPGLPFAVLAIPVLALGFLLPTTEEGRERQKNSRQIQLQRASFSRQQECPSCNELISAEAFVCGICGHRFKANDA